VFGEAKPRVAQEGEAAAAGGEPAEKPKRTWTKGDGEEGKFRSGKKDGFKVKKDSKGGRKDGKLFDEEGFEIVGAEKAHAKEVKLARQEARAKVAAAKAAAAAAPAPGEGVEAADGAAPAEPAPKPAPAPAPKPAPKPAAVAPKPALKTVTKAVSKTETRNLFSVLGDDDDDDE